MSVPDTAVSTRPNNVPFVRSAVPADHAAIRDVYVIGVPDARRISVPAYYLGRPAALWLAAFTPWSTTRKSPRASCASTRALLVSDNT